MDKDRDKDRDKDKDTDMKLELALRVVRYGCDRTFGPRAHEVDVHAAVLEPLLCRALAGEGDGTVVLYGQTGAGKTYTLMGMLRRVEAALDEVDGGVALEVSLYELAAVGCCDLLNR